MQTTQPPPPPPPPPHPNISNEESALRFFAPLQEALSSFFIVNTHGNTRFFRPNQMEEAEAFLSTPKPEAPIKETRK